MLWEDVQVFLAVARAKSLTGASAQLGISHSSVSRQLAALERRSHATLFSRSAAGYSMTDLGRGVYAAALKMEANYLELTRKLAASERSARHNVRVSAPDVLISQLGPCLHALGTEAQILLELNVDNAPVDLDRLESEVAIRASRAPAAHLVGARVAYTAWAVYAAKSRRLLGVDDPQLSWIGYGANLSALPVSDWMRENVPAERIALRTNSTLAAQAFARAGVGAACLWCLAGDSDPELVRLTGPLRDVASDLWLLIHPDMKRSRSVTKARTFLANALRDARARIEGRG